MHKAAVIGLDLLEHVEGLLRITHLQGEIRLGKHDAHFFRCSSEFTNCPGEGLLRIFKVFLLAEDLNEVQEDAGALFLAELLLDVCYLLRIPYAW